MVFRLTSATPGLLPAAGFLVDRGPGAAFGLFLRNTPVLVTSLYVLSLTLLLVSVCGFVAARHDDLPSWPQRETLAKAVGFLRGSVRPQDACGGCRWRRWLSHRLDAAATGSTCAVQCTGRRRASCEGIRAFRPTRVGLAASPAGGVRQMFETRRVTKAANGGGFPCNWLRRVGRVRRSDAQFLVARRP